MEATNGLKSKENKMGTMPVNRLLITISLPMMISMLVQALYNIVDSIFVAKICEDALTAVSLAFPLQTLIIAVASGTGVGVNALLSKALGAKDHERVSRVAEHSIFLAIISYAIFLVIGIFAVTPFYGSQIDDPEIVKYGIEYLSVVCIFSFGIFAQFVFERMLQGTGKTMFTMITQGVGAIVNIILDPILIFGLFGFPRMEVTGAAVATVIGQIVAAALACFFNFKFNHEVKIRLKKFRPDGGLILSIYKIGLPSIIMQAIGSVMNYGMNQILVAFESTAATVFGAYYKVQSFIFMPVFGLNNGLVPIVAYNYGAGKRKRLIKVIKLAVIYATAIMTIGFVVFQVAPGLLLSMFEASDRMLEIGIPALRIISISFLAAGFCIISGTVFQALGNAGYSLVVSVARQLVVLLPAAYLLARTGNVINVWWAFPIAEVMSFTMSVLCMLRVNKKIIRHIPDNE